MRGRRVKQLRREGRPPQLAGWMCSCGAGGSADDELVAAVAFLLHLEICPRAPLDERSYSV